MTLSASYNDLDSVRNRGFRDSAGGPTDTNLPVWGGSANVLVGLSVYGLGFGLIVAPATSTVMVAIPKDEIDSLACNVLAVRTRVVVMLEGNPQTQAALEAKGVEVHTYAGREISMKGCGGPTCLTRPLERAP